MNLSKLDKFIKYLERRLSYSTVIKARRLAHRVKLSLIKPHVIYFTVPSEHGVYLVSIDFLKKKFWCDCKFFALHRKICSHILAVLYKLRYYMSYKEF